MSIDEKKLRTWLEENRDGWDAHCERKRELGDRAEQQYCQGRAASHAEVLRWLDANASPVSLETGDGGKRADQTYWVIEGVEGDFPRVIASGGPGFEEPAAGETIEVVRRREYRRGYAAIDRAAEAADAREWIRSALQHGQITRELADAIDRSLPAAPAETGDGASPAPEGDTEEQGLIDYSSPLATVITGWECMKSPAGLATAEAFCAVDAAVAKLREAAASGDTEERIVAAADELGRHILGMELTFADGGGLEGWLDQESGTDWLHEVVKDVLLAARPAAPAEPGDTETVTLSSQDARVLAEWADEGADTADGHPATRRVRAIVGRIRRETSPIRPASSTEGGEE